MEWNELIRKIIGHLIIYSFAITQFILGIWILLKWIKKNFKFDFSPIIKIDGISSNSNSLNTKYNKEELKKDLGVIDVDYKKNIFISDVDNKNVKIDEKIKGKVKTQKDKLKKLRGK